MQHFSEAQAAAPTISPLINSGVRREFLGVPIDCLTLTETIEAADRAIQRRQPLQHACINVAKFVAMRSNAELDVDVRSSDVISIDGMGIVWAAWLMGISIPERVTGVDVMERVILLCATKGYRPYFLGARRDVLQQAIINIQTRFPGLDIAGSRDGYFAPEEETGVVTAIKSSEADCLFIGMPTPRKERFLARHRDDLGSPFIMGVGGGLDVLAGRVRRAPRLVQEMGFEWLFRTVQEPLRLGPRYLRTNVAFAGLMVKALMPRSATRSSTSRRLKARQR